MTRANLRVALPGYCHSACLGKECSRETQAIHEQDLEAKKYELAFLEEEHLKTLQRTREEMDVLQHKLQGRPPRDEDLSLIALLNDRLLYCEVPVPPLSAISSSAIRFYTDTQAESQAQAVLIGSLSQEGELLRS